MSVSLTRDNNLVDKSNDPNMNSLLLWFITAGKTIAGQPWPRPARGPSPQARRLWCIWNVLHDACSQAMHQKRSRNATTHDSGEHCVTRKMSEGVEYFLRGVIIKYHFQGLLENYHNQDQFVMQRQGQSLWCGVVILTWSRKWPECPNFSQDVRSWWGTENDHAWFFWIKLLEVMDWKLLKIWVWWGLGAADFGSSARQRSNIRSGHGREENHTRHSSRLHGSGAPHTWLRARKDARLRKASELAHFSLWHTKRHYY